MDFPTPKKPSSKTFAEAAQRHSQTTASASLFSAVNSQDMRIKNPFSECPKMVKLMSSRALKPPSQESAPSQNSPQPNNQTLVQVTSNQRAKIQSQSQTSQNNEKPSSEFKISLLPPTQPTQPNDEPIFNGNTQSYDLLDTPPRQNGSSSRPSREVPKNPIRREARGEDDHLKRRLEERYEREWRSMVADVQAFRWKIEWMGAALGVLQTERRVGRRQWRHGAK